MKNFTQTLVVGMMAMLLGTVVFAAQSARAEGTAKVEVIKNPDGGYGGGSYYGTYQKMAVESVLMDDEGNGGLELVITGVIGTKDREVRLHLPASYASTAPCPVVGATHRNKAKSSTASASFWEGLREFSAGKGEADATKDRSGEVTNLRFYGKSATGSFHFSCWDAGRENFYHVIGSFDVKWD